MDVITVDVVCKILRCNPQLMMIQRLHNNSLLEPWSDSIEKQLKQSDVIPLQIGPV